MSQPTESSILASSLRGLIETAASPGLAHAEALGLIGSSPAWLAAGLLQRDLTPLTILAADQETALSFHRALSFYHGRAEDILLFPHWETDPYTPLSPHPEVEAQRLATLANLAAGRGRALVTTARAVLQKVIPRQMLDKLRLRLEVGNDYRRDELLTGLQALGYQRTLLVEDRGSFAVRGDLLDLYPPMHEQPVRLSFFGDELEEIRCFETGSQRSTGTTMAVLELVPAREMILAGEPLETLLTNLRDRCAALEMPRPQRDALLEEFREGLLGPGREQLLPLNYAQLDSLLDYLAPSRWLLLDPPAVTGALDEFCELVRSGASRAAAHQEIHAAADSFYLSAAELEERLRPVRRLELSRLQIIDLESNHPVFRVSLQANSDLRPTATGHDGRLGDLTDRLRQWLDEDWRLLVVCHQRGQAERLRDLLAAADLAGNWQPDLVPGCQPPAGLTVTLGSLGSGFRDEDGRLAVLTDDEIFGPRSHRRVRRDRRVFESSLADLKAGDLVVHTDYGIARYLGLEHLAAGGIAGDFLHLEYAGHDRLYLPIERIERVQKYVADGPAPRLDRMGSGAWEKAKLKARAAIEELARDLLQIQARRQMAQGFRYSPPDRLFTEFEAAFPYEETPDQLDAIAAVLDDMMSEQPVDRLICGDVGYGKTEVAIRAAFKAVLDSRQVAFLVPTTVLACQHLETLKKRLAGYPVNIDMLSRFRTPAEQKKILTRTAAGQVDILIGTHRLLQRDVRFKELGLIIVDEEQRFGVAHKERLKKMRAEVDVLTLSATPIPRTLHLSLAGLRQLSIIDTPPVDRQAIRTYVTRFDDDLIRDAILREFRRGGQVYFVHNRVESIQAMADFLGKLVPQANIGIGHGQMSEKDLEKVMLDFIEGRTNLLVCTTIIENGLDIANANTILINRADCFGLSQLYQLRGRVGRSHQRAYAYLMIPGETLLTHDARERLRILQEQTELGAGFRIARHDLELRGAGDLLGSRQAGQIEAVGFEMYTELLEETIAELQGRQHEQRVDPEIRLGLSAYLPESYVADPNQRLVLYRKLAGADDDSALYQVIDELRDRYGELPSPAELLLEVMKLRILMKQLQIDAAEYDGHNLVVSFPPQTRVTPEQILALIEKDNRTYRFSPDYRLSIRLGRLPQTELLPAIKKELQGLCRL
ncbi:MAG: transcription-repair coupling factor [Desulfuromonadales bacterium]|nr:transcription-repair coupling factor [Desulfuromonadales bacterium]